jgi:HPt (histidine-containing phosphotransfer) domain-containing protein
MNLSPAARPLPEDDDVPAVDHAGGVARLMGDDALFARVLARFRKEYRHAAAGIRGALDAGDLAQAQRRAHTLKGAAGMIEAVPLRRHAQRLEHLLRAGGGAGIGSGAYAVLEELRIELDRVLRDLDAVTATLPPRHDGIPAARQPAGTQDKGHADDAVERLTALLDEGNGDAVDVVREAAPLLAARLGRDACERIADAVESFDFDGALELLRRGSGAT